MRWFTLTVASMVGLALGAGCTTAPTPAPGLAALQVDVLAEPKTGYSTANNHVLVYDAQSSFGYGASSSGNSASKGDEFDRVDYGSLDEVVVWVEPASAAKPSSASLPDIHLDVDPQKSADHLSAALTVGQRLILRNNGSKAGTVYSVSDGNEFHLGTLPPGASGEYVVGSPGLIEIVTTSLEEPIATVYAAPTPWVRLTRAGQTVDFNDLPPGRYKVVSWHPRLPGHSTTVKLLPDQIGSASIQVGVNGLPKVEQP